MFIEQKQHAKMQNPREQDYSENEMLAFLKIYRPPRKGFENFHEFNSHYLDCDVYELCLLFSEF